MPAARDLSVHMEAVARRLLGEPNARLSKAAELRYGRNGSLAVDLKHGTWFDHETQDGGGVLDLIRRETGRSNGDAVEWVKAEIGLPDDGPAQSVIAATYDYRDNENQLAFQVVRLEPKSFRQRRPDGRGGWTWSVKGSEPLPYRLPELIDAPGDEVFIVEGEKDVDSLHRLGVVATCNAGGAGKWADVLGEHLRDRKVYILPDNDAAGRDHAQAVAAAVHGKASEVRIVELPDLPDKGDVSDWLRAGNNVDNLHELARTAAVWTPARAPSPLGTVLWDEVDTLPAAEWLIRDLLPAGGMSVLYGEPGTAKSFLALQLAVCVATGMDWFGRKVAGGPTAYLAAEGHMGMRKRIAALKAARLDPSVPVRFALVPRALDLLSPDGDMEALLAELKRLALLFGEPVRYVAIDTLSRVLAGGNENYPDDMGRLIMNVDRIREATGAHVMLLHHTAKDTALGMRGHSALRGATDTAILLEKDEVSGRIAAKVDKQKDGEEGPLATLTLSPVALGEDQDGQPVTSCVLDVELPAGARPRRRKERLPDDVKLALLVLDELLGKDPLDPPPELPETFKRAVPLVVPLEAWRTAFYARKSEERDNRDTVRKAFNRATGRLQTADIIKVYNKWAGRIQ